MQTHKRVEVLQNIEINDLKIVGKSISTLARFANEKLPVSNGFVITTLGYQHFLDFSDIKKYYDNSKKTDSSNYIESLKGALEAIEIPDILNEEISKSYSKISGFTDAYVNLRALILDREGNEVEHRSFVVLDVRGDQKIKDSIKNIYKSIILDNKDIVEKYFDGSLQIVLLVQKAQQAEASGVVFTTDVVTNDKNKLVIEAVYGLESIIEIDSIVPDQYIYDKTSSTIVEKHITNQEYMAVRQPGRTSDNIQKVKISLAWQKRQKLDDKHILTLAKTGKIIEEGLEEPQELLWSFESGKIWINFIESSKKIKLDNKQPTLQDLIDEQFVSDSVSDKDNETITTHTDSHDGVDVNVHIPESISANKDVLMDLVLSNAKSDNHQEISSDAVIVESVSKDIPDSSQELSGNIKDENISESKEEKVSTTNAKAIENKEEFNTMKEEIFVEPLLEGKYYAGGKTEGEVCFDPEKCNNNSILVLKGDENLPSNIKVSGFIIEDESEILAQRLNEYFEVPTITGVPLARKILKQGELVKIDGDKGHIHETVPYADQTSEEGEIEMNFITNQHGDKRDAHFTVPVNKKEDVVIHAEIHPENHPHNVQILDEVSESDNEDLNKPELLSPNNLTEDYNIDSSLNCSLNDDVTESVIKNEVNTIDIRIDTKVNDELYSETDSTQKISKLLDLVEEDSQIVEVREDILDDNDVKGLDKEDQFNAWGESLEKIISATKDIAPSKAADAIEEIIGDTLEITEDSKEISFDRDEEYIAINIQKEEENKEYNYPFIPTATKVYVNLVDEKLPSGFKNFDGVVFASSFDQELYLELLESILENAEDKEVLAICPPYEIEALERFLNSIYDLRNKGYRNLSLILPDYRNKKEIADVKKLLSVTGLKRSSTFSIFANVSRAINVFRIAELNKSVVDGVFFDLFRLKMNMLGVERHTASTKYVEGMRNLVEYIHENMPEIEKSIVNVTGFESPDKVLDHLLKFKFLAVSCSLPQVNTVKEEISSIEKKQIIHSTGYAKNGRLKRKK